jgi:hypothetical protein
MHGFVALYLIACLDPTNHNTCVSLPVTDSTQAQPDGSEMSIMGCMGIERCQLGEEVLGGSSGYAQGLSLRRLVLPNRK